VAQAPAPAPMTARELSGAISRAHALYAAAVAAAAEEYDEGRRKIAAVRKAQTAGAREKRDQQIRELQEQFAREPDPAPEPEHQ
jgi:hypothetical protein